jgi:hypothetical protein
MLQRPFFTPVVVGFWLVTTGWLVGSKILPSLSPGSPPGHQAFFASSGGLVPVAWTLECNDHPIGWAFTQANHSHRDGLLVDSRLHFDRLPWDEVLPAWASAFVHHVSLPVPHAGFDARGRLSIGSDGQLRSFSSVVTMPGVKETLVLTGMVDDGKVSMFMAAGELRYETTRHLPTTAMVGDELSPLATLPGLHEGRRWTVPMYSPLRPGQSPLEILHAEVGREETLYWGGSLTRVHVVSYREDPSSSRPPRCRLWVDHSGRVLRQEAALLGARVAFIRQSDDEAIRLAAQEGVGAVEPGPADVPEPATP